MNITFFIDDITKVGGVESVITKISTEIVNYENFNITIVSIFERQRENIYFNLSSNVKVVYLNKSIPDRGFIKLAKLLETSILDYINNNKIDILISLYTFNNFVVAKNRRKINCKIIACQHGQYFADSFKLNLLKKIFWRNFDKVVLLTEEDRKIYEKFNKNSVVIRNPVRIDKNFRFNINSKKIVYIGRLSTEKSVDYLIKAFSEINNKFPEWKLIIWGEGEEKENLIKLVEILGIQHNVEFRGFTNNIEQAYSEAGVIALTSQTEGLPMLILESKFMGIPVVSFDISTGPKELIQHNIDGILVKKNNTKEFSKALETLIENDSIRNKIAIEAFKSSDLFDSALIIEQWKDIFKELTYLEGEN